MKDKKKILFFVPKLHNGGAERFTVNILRSIDTALFKVSLVVITAEGEYFDLIPSFVKVYNLKSSKTVFSIFKLRKLILRLNPDIVFSTLVRSHIALDQALSGFKKKPYIILRSSSSPKLMQQHRKLSFIKNLLLQKAYNNADLILAQTPEMKNELEKYYKINKNKIQVFINILDTDFIDEQIKNIENPFNSKNINVVAAGRLSQEKGYDVLISAFKKIIEHNDKFFLHIIGNDNGEKGNLEYLVNSLHLQKNVKFWDFQKNPYKFFFFSDLFVLSSRREGLPNAVLENLYLNKPIVATKCIPFMYELIKDGKNGFLVDVEDKEQLSIAILNYKDIRRDSTKFIQNTSNINTLFSSIVNKGIK